MESLQKQDGHSNGKSWTPWKSLRRILEKLQEAAKGMADKNSPGNEANAKSSLSLFQRFPSRHKKWGCNLPQLDEAISALAANQPDLMLKDLQAAVTDLEKIVRWPRSLQQLQQQMEKLGKDLAEQLKNGQPEAAQQTLQKMISKLNSANLSPRNWRNCSRMFPKRLIPPAITEGGDHSERCCQQLQAGDKPNAAQALPARPKNWKSSCSNGRCSRTRCHTR